MNTTNQNYDFCKHCGAEYFILCHCTKAKKEFEEFNDNFDTAYKEDLSNTYVPAGL